MLVFIYFGLLLLFLFLGFLLLFLLGVVGGLKFSFMFFLLWGFFFMFWGFMMLWLFLLFIDLVFFGGVMFSVVRCLWFLDDCGVFGMNILFFDEVFFFIVKYISVLLFINNFVYVLLFFFVLVEYIEVVLYFCYSFYMWCYIVFRICIF